MKRRIVLGFSGGVDSAVAALLLAERGYEVLGLYLDVGTHAGRDDAIQAARLLGIELETRDVRGELERCVCTPFLEGYLAGKTLNPCLLCNPAVKFRNLAEYALERGADKIATGHYSVIRGGTLYTGNPANDQSYQLCLVPKEYLRILELPLGDMPKTRVRELARAAGISIADKPDSMDICFIPDHDYAGWIENRVPAPKPGNALFHGEIIGRHEGIHRYTVGQRWRELYNERRLYVSEIRPGSNEIALELWEDTFKSEVDVEGVNWLVDIPSGAIQGRVRVRHTRWEMPECTIAPTEYGVHIETQTPLRAPARGQAAALYSGDMLLGGGIVR